MLDIQRKMTGGLAAAFEIDTVMETIQSVIVLNIYSLKTKKQTMVQPIFYSDERISYYKI